MPPLIAWQQYNEPVTHKCSQQTLQLQPRCCRHHISCNVLRNHRCLQSHRYHNSHRCHRYDTWHKVSHHPQDSQAMTSLTLAAVSRLMHTRKCKATGTHPPKRAEPVTLRSPASQSHTLDSRTVSLIKTSHPQRPQQLLVPQCLSATVESACKGDFVVLVNLNYLLELQPSNLPQNWQFQHLLQPLLKLNTRPLHCSVKPVSRWPCNGLAKALLKGVDVETSCYLDCG